MPRLEASILINRPIEEVFAFLSDFKNDAKWQSSVLEAEITSEGPLGVGTTYRYTVEVMSRRIETKGELTAYEPPHKYAWKATSGPFPMSGGLTLESVEGGTRVTNTIDAEPGGFFKIALPLLIRSQQKQTETDLGKLKQLLEV